MTKTKKNTRTQQSSKDSFISKLNLDEILPQKYHVLAVILLMIILFLIFLNPLYFGNKTFQSGDIVASHSMEPYVSQSSGGFTLWNPLIFCGMPAYALGTSYTWFNIIYVAFTSVRNLFTSFFAVEYTKWSFYLILLGITSFLFMRQLSKNTMISLFTGVATAFSTGLIVFLYIGHVTKLASLSMFPLIFLMIFRLQKKFTIVDFLILVITLQLFIQPFHVQIIFYTFLAVAIYYIYFFIRSLVKKEKELTGRILKSAGGLIVAALIALLIQSDSITQIYQYTPYSTRGEKSIVEKTTGKAEKSESEYYSYHTDWSFSPEEIATFIVPSYYGFGRVTYQGPLTNGQKFETNAYFGQMPFVDVAMYMGVLVFFLGLFAVFTKWKDPMVQFFTILAGFALLLSFGKNFPILFDLMFYHFPYFDKFRVPSMSLVLVQMSFPMLAGLGLMKIIGLRKDREDNIINIIKYAAYGFTGIFILGLLLNGSLNSWFAGRVSDYAAGIQAAQPRLAGQFNALADFIAGIFVTDFLFAFGFLTLAFWSAYLYINAKLSKDVFVAVVVLLTIIDLWRVDARGEQYTPQPDLQSLFKQPDYITAIKNQHDTQPHRLLNIRQDGSLGSYRRDSNFNAYFLEEDFYGYSGIKPRSYQDLMDVIGPVNPTLWRMLNVKYIATSTALNVPGFKQLSKTDKGFTYLNMEALPRLYFVDSVAVKPDIDVLNMIKQRAFDPKNVAFIHDGNLQVNKPDSSASVNITEYNDEIVGADIIATGKNFLFLGNTYLPVGWKAYVDGNKTQIYKVNHGFMGIVVTAGKHKVEFKYAPTSFYISKYISLILSSLVVGGLILGLFFQKKKKVAKQ